LIVAHGLAHYALVASSLLFAALHGRMLPLAFPMVWIFALGDVECGGRVTDSCAHMVAYTQLVAPQPC